MISSGVAWMEPTLARASVTPNSTCCSWAAYPFTVLTRLGIRSARRWYWLMTSDHADLTCSSWVCIELYPQPDNPSTVNKAEAKTETRIEFP